MSRVPVEACWDEKLNPSFSSHAFFANISDFRVRFFVFSFPVVRTTLALANARRRRVSPNAFASNPRPANMSQMVRLHRRHSVGDIHPVPLVPRAI